MTVKDLIDKLKELDQSSSVVLLPQNEGLVNPIISITGAWEGFDWWQGMVILNTDRAVRGDFSDIFKRDAEIEAKSKSEYRRKLIMKDGIIN